MSDGNAIVRDGDDAKVMAATGGWKALSAWVDDVIRAETDAITRGVASWDEYQRAVGRIGAYRAVQERPSELVKKGNDVIAGGGDYE